MSAQQFLILLQKIVIFKISEHCLRRVSKLLPQLMDKTFAHGDLFTKSKIIFKNGQ